MANLSVASAQMRSRRTGAITCRGQKVPLVPACNRFVFLLGVDRHSGDGRAVLHRRRKTRAAFRPVVMDPPDPCGTHLGEGNAGKLVRAEGFCSGRGSQFKNKN